MLNYQLFSVRGAETAADRESHGPHFFWRNPWRALASYASRVGQMAMYDSETISSLLPLRDYHINVQHLPAQVFSPEPVLFQKNIHISITTLSASYNHPHNCHPDILCCEGRCRKPENHT